jgi:hypothetical protein
MDFYLRQLVTYFEPSCYNHKSRISPVAEHGSAKLLSEEMLKMWFVENLWQKFAR